MKRLLPILFTLSLASAQAAEVLPTEVPVTVPVETVPVVIPTAAQSVLDAKPLVAHPFNGQDYLRDIIANTENRKKELDQISTLIDSTVHFQMQEITKLINEIKRIMEKNRRMIEERYNTINTIIKGMTTVDFRVKALYPEQLKTIIEVEKFIKG
jgi:peptidoglycan hydrolase CwlO-like protein